MARADGVMLYRTERGIVVEQGRRYVGIREIDWDDLLNGRDLLFHLRRLVAKSKPGRKFNPDAGDLLPPIGAQEVWAAGVTYFRSRDARVEESKQAGGGDFYVRVYEAERPELFFKATPHRVAGHRQPVKIRRDARWSVPEPELALVLNSDGQIVGFTIGNDMSSRDIEGENPLYLPQAKVYDRSCALGPGILVTDRTPAPATKIELEIRRDGASAFAGATTLKQLKRTPESLAEFLFRDNSFPSGCFLLTGTGIVPPDSFSLRRGDEVRISIEGLGTLINPVM
jgi:2-dehydro-3-deoxy-D-arabinonate dehydratase